MNAQKISDYLVLYKEHEKTQQVGIPSEDIRCEPLIWYVENKILSEKETYHTFSPTELEILHYLKERQSSTGISNSSIAALLGVTEKELETQLKLR